MKCIECVNCSKDEMKCYPKSKDCMSEYNLTEEDLYNDVKCDFAEYKNNIRGNKYESRRCGFYL